MKRASPAKEMNEPLSLMGPLKMEEAELGK
jgi:hypothetical protein